MEDSKTLRSVIGIFIITNRLLYLMKKDVKHKKPAYALLALAIALLMLAWNFGLNDGRFWVMSIGSLVLWVVAAFMMMHAAEKRAVFFKIVATVVVMVIAPMAFIYFEASRGIAVIKSEPFTQFVAFEAAAAFSFIISAAGLARQLAALRHKNRMKR